MFKRRKPDEPTQDDRSPVADPLPPPGQPAAVQPGPQAPPHHDSGVGVPPYRPALNLAPTPTKEPASMARAPFATSPIPAQQPPPPQPMPVQPRPAAAPTRVPGIQSADRRTLVVGRGISLQGVVQDAERLVVEGTVEATMIHATELMIAPGGVFKGEVEIEDAEIAGTIDGTLTVRGNLTVRATGRVLGTARCRRLQVEDGGQITGRIEMLTEARSAEPSREPISQLQS